MAKIHPFPEGGAIAPPPRLVSVLKSPHEISMFSITKVAKKLQRGRGFVFKIRQTFLSPETQSASLYIFRENGWTRKQCTKIVQNPWFERSVLLLILGSCLTLAMYDPMQTGTSKWNGGLDIVDKVFSVLFAIEAILRVISQCFVFGPDAYLSSGWRRLDFIIVVACFISFIPGANKAGMVRVIRVLRPLKAISNLSGARMMVTTLIESLPLMMDVGVLILWLMLVFSVVGMQQWLGKMSRRCFDSNHVLDDNLADMPCVSKGQGMHCPAGEFCLDTGQDPDNGYTSFNNLPLAAIAVFQVLTMANWTNLLYQIQGSGPAWVAIVWCLLLIAIGALFSLNLLVAVIGSKFSQENMLEKRRGYRSEQSPELLTRSTSFHILKRKLGKRVYRISKKIFSPLWWDLPFSHVAQKVINHPRFETGIMSVICLQTLLLSLQYYGIQEWEAKAISDIGYGTSAVFIAEMVLKVWGLSLGGYFSSSQNCFDAFIVLMTIIELFLGSQQLKALQAFRLLRILRTVRIFRAYKNFRRLMDSIMHGLVSLREFLLLLGICIFIFAVLGMQLFGGNSSFDGQRTNFNTIWMSVIIMFEGLTATTYSQTMWLAMEGVGWPAALYFICWMIVGNIGLLNLLLAIMIDHFNSDPTEGEGDKSSKRHAETGDETGIFGMIAKRRQRIFAHEAERTAAWLRSIGEEYVPRKKMSFAGRLGSTIAKLRGFSSLMRSKKSMSTTSTSGAASSAASSQQNSTTQNSISSRARSVTTRGNIPARSRQSVTGRNFLYKAANAAEAKVAQKEKARADVEVSPWKTVATKMGVEKKSIKVKSVIAILAAMQPSVTSPATKAWSAGNSLSPSQRVTQRVTSVLLPRSPSPEATASPDTSIPRIRAQRAPSVLGVRHGPESPQAESPKAVVRSRRTQSIADMATLRGRPEGRSAENSPNGSHVSERLSFDGEATQESDAQSEQDALLPRFEEFLMKRETRVPEDVTSLAAPAPRGNMWRQRSMRRRTTALTEEEEIDEDEWRKLPGACLPSKRQLAPLLTWEVLPPPIPGDLVIPFKPEEPDEEEPVSKAELRRRAGIPTSSGTLISTALPTVGHQRFAALPPKSITSNSGRSANSRTKKRGEMKAAAIAVGRALQDLLANPMESASCMRHRSLGFFPPTSRVRRALFLLVSSKEYEWFGLVMVLASCVSLAMDCPDLDDTSPMKRGLWLSDIVFASFFSLECMCKIVIMGLYKHEGAFWRSNWNKLDLFVTLCSLLACFVSPVHQGDQIKALRSFRLLRALRPLRMISKLKNLRMVILTLTRSLPSCINVIALGIFFFIIYGVLGVQLFEGTFYSCNDTTVRNVYECVGTFTDPSSGLSTPRVWSNAPVNFDNLWYAIVAIFVVVTLDDWPTLMYQAMDGVGIGKQPQLNHQVWASLYFIFLILMGAIFWANLLAGVVTDCYSKLPPEDKDMLFITESQKRWAQAIKMKRYENTEAMTKSAPPSNNLVRKAVWYLVQSKAFDYTVLALIIGNIVLLAAQHKDEGRIFTDVTVYGNYAFTYSFCLELLLKLIALGPRKYWADSWNRFDFVVVAGSVVDLNLKGINIGARVFRLGRLFKIIKSTRGLRTLVNAFVGALPAMFNVGLLFFLMIFIAAILAMDLFGSLPYGVGIFPDNNFRNVGNSLLVCLKLFTGDNWTPIYFQTSCSGSGSDCFVHILVPVFVFFYTIIMRFMLLNLVLSVILDRFTDSATYEGLLSTDNFFDALQRKMLLDGFVRKLKMKIRNSPNRQKALQDGDATPDQLLQNPVPAGLVAFALSKAKQREHQRALNGPQIGRGSDEEA